MIDDLIKIASVVDFFTPKEIKNIKVNFKVKELGLRFICDDKNIGLFRVFVLDLDNELIAYLESNNKQDSIPKIGENTKDYSKEFLFNVFHMCRCRREFERLGDINYSKGFDYFRKKLINSYQKNLFDDVVDVNAKVINELNLKQLSGK